MLETPLTKPRRLRTATRSRRSPGRWMRPARRVINNTGRTFFPGARGRRLALTNQEGRNELFAQKFSQGCRIGCRAYGRDGRHAVCGSHDSCGVSEAVCERKGIV